jgi:predicted ATPase
MISKLEIHNYKSLHELTLEVGRFNVLIGENGCGKSNLLEAIALTAAAAATKLDNEFLTSRGIRVTEPKLMRSAFDDENLSESIKIDMNFYDIAVPQKYEFNHNNQSYSKWNMVNIPLSKLALSKLALLWSELSDINSKVDKISAVGKEVQKKEELYERTSYVRKEILNIVTDNCFRDNKIMAENYLEYYQRIIDNEKILQNFIIYSPENTALRNFSKEGQIEPLGINGEGLLKLLKVTKHNSPEQWQEIQDSLELFDWFDGIEIPDISSNDDQVSITDRYLTQVIDQRSANEGFLFVLFYIALMVSKYTPKIFAIDNIDTSLNPKLCTKLIKVLINLAKKYDKQVFVTTHNPAILDGINLGDDEQRLLVVSRNKLGHTNFKRIELADKPRSSNNEDLKLSEAFLRGYLGGLPKGF